MLPPLFSTEPEHDERVTFIGELGVPFLTTEQFNAVAA